MFPIGQIGRQRMEVGREGDGRWHTDQRLSEEMDLSSVG